MKNLKDYNKNNMRLLNGDSAERLKELEDASVDSIVTDPPAGISFMQSSKDGWDSDRGGRDRWIEWLSGIMKEAYRVLKPGGHALVWALPRTSHWTVTALEDAGFEIREKHYHCYGSGFPKSRSLWNNDFKKNIEEQLRQQGVEGDIKWK